MVRNDIEANYFAAIVDKHKYAQSIRKPKIIQIFLEEVLF